MSELSKELQDVAREIAYEDFNNSHGFGLYHTSPQVQNEEIARAERKVSKWVERVSPAVRKAFLEDLIRELGDDPMYYEIDDQWGSSGVAARDHIVEHLKSKLS